MKIQVKVLPKQFVLSDYSRAKLHDFVVAEGGEIRAELVTLTPESRNQRRYLMGGLIKLLVYLDGNDYQDSKVCENYFEFYKKEFFPEVLNIKGKVQVFGKSTKGSRNLNAFIEKVQDFLHEQYGIAYDNPAILPDTYNRFRDELFMTGEWDTYLDYCKSMKYI